MHVPRFLVVLAGFLVVGVLVSAQMAPVAPVEGDHGWAGPHPMHLVHYRAEIPMKKNGGWSDRKILLAAAPGNGLVITKIVASSASGSWPFEELRLLKNTTEEVFRRHGGTRYVEIDLVHGIPVKGGLPVSAQVSNGGLSGTSPKMVLHIYGYTW